RPGQRLVTVDGALWRWDGFVAAADAPSAAAERLAQRNRLAELDAEIAEVRAGRDRLKTETAARVAELDAARQVERERGEAWRAAQHAIGTAQQALDKAQRAIGDLATRQSALEEARVRLASSLAEAETVHDDAEKALAESGDETAATELSAAKQAALAALREQAERARLQLGNFESTARRRTTRLGQIAGDRASWERRQHGARSQLETLGARSREVAEQLAALSNAPDGFAQRQAALDSDIAEA